MSYFIKLLNLKNLKFIFIFSIIISVGSSFSMAQSCTEITPGFGLCGASEICNSTVCSCPSVGNIVSGAVCGIASPVTCHLGSTVLAVGKTGFVFQSGVVDFGVSCISEVVTCIDNAGVGQLVGSVFTESSCVENSPSNCSFGGNTVLHGNSIVAYQSGTVDFGNFCISETRSCNNGVLDGSYTNDTCTTNTMSFNDCMLDSILISDGDTITVYQNSSVSCVSTCISEVRTCTSGILNGTYINQSCSVSSCGGGGGGGSSTPNCKIKDLICVDGIYEKNSGVNCRRGSLGDKCSLSADSIKSDSNDMFDSTDIFKFDRIGDISASLYSAELNLAYLYAYNMGITDMFDIFYANMEGNLIRSHMAKMLVEWASHVRALTVNTGINCDFDDIKDLKGQDLYDFIIKSCQMGLMGLDSNGNSVSNFHPNDLVTRAQFGTVLSRAIWGNYYNGSSPYYKSHLNALNQIGVMKNISNPWMYELRGYVMLMLLRANQLLK